jgi:glutamyl-tRNA synthetase
MDYNFNYYLIQGKTMAKPDPSKVRVRFAPSPTGHLHLGGARTALFNWLFAKHHGGDFILRIEDTDRTRSTEEANKTIIEGMKWLGLLWDEGPNVPGQYGPYHQTERLQIYKEHAQKLLDEGKAYMCFCTPEELEVKRKEAEARKEAPRYDGKCRKLPPTEIEKLKSGGRPHVLRFMLPPVGDTSVDDLVRGKVVFKNEVLDDFVIMKSDGFPTYNFAAVVDDSLMKITHVVRGDDHLSNTPRQILLYQAFGLTPPQFAHIPMILGPDKARLSKRHGATSVTEYRDLGYLPEAMVNYLARLGWGHGDQEIFSREELIEKFTLKAVNKNAATFDVEKLNWLNGQYIRKALPERIVDLCMPYLEEAYPSLKESEKQKEGLEYVSRVVKCLQDRIRVTSDIASLSSYFFTEEIEYDAKAREKHLQKAEVPSILTKLREKLSSVKPFDKQNIEKVFKALAGELNVKLGVVIHPARVALTGRAESPGIYDVVEILGRERCLKRIDDAIAMTSGK